MTWILAGPGEYTPLEAMVRPVAEERRLKRARFGRRPGRSIAFVALACAAAIGCASAPESREESSGRQLAHLDQQLVDYRSLGFLAGSPEFPVVGRVVAFQGPHDSAYVGLVASMPPSALRFAREGRLFTASYLASATFVAGGDTVQRLSRREIVRVDDFTHTADTGERVFFQKFVTLPPGTYSVDLTIRELSTRREGSRRFTVRIPKGDTVRSQLSTPLVAFRATARVAYDQPPPLIVAPRSTASASRPSLFLVAEDYSSPPSPLRLGVRQRGEVLWTVSVEPEPVPGGPGTAIAPIPLRHLPPGLSEVFVTRVRDGMTRTSPLIVALDDEWALAGFSRAVDYLRYVVSSDTLELWKRASPRVRSRMWEEFWDLTDPDPTTAENEFLGTYFERMAVAEKRFDEPGIPGWRTDRGRVLALLGEPDREVVRGALEVGQKNRIEWSYEESLPFRVRLVFVDQSDFGVFTLTQRSRFTLRRAYRRLREASSESPGAEDEAAPR